MLSNTVSNFWAWVDDLLEMSKDPKLIIDDINARFKFKNSAAEDPTGDLGMNSQNKGCNR